MQIEDTLFVSRLVDILNIASGLVGVVVVGMIVIGGIQYIAAGDNAQAVQEAKNRIKNAIIGLVLFIMMFGILNFVVPGGLFN